MTLIFTIAFTDKCGEASQKAGAYGRKVQFTQVTPHERALSMFEWTRFIKWSCSCLIIVLLNVAARASERELFEAEKGPHHRVWNWVSRSASAAGVMSFRTNSYVELATGLHYWDGQQWEVSREEIEVIDGQAVARQGPHKVTFAANLNSPGAVALTDPEGKRFRSHILGLAYTDHTGRSVLVAKTRDCEGVIVGGNQVYYRDALDGDCLADVRYVYSKSGFEQDLILVTSPPPPEEYGLNSGTTRLELFTEFIEAPSPSIKRITLRLKTLPLRDVAELMDEVLNFGVMKMETGQIFRMEDQDAFSDGSTPSGKSWERIEGRQFLIEKVDLDLVAPQLRDLPNSAAVPSKGREVFGRDALIAQLVRPSRRSDPWQAKDVAAASRVRAGLVWDYLTINSSLTNYTFRGDTTYYISGNLSLYGTTVLEGGSVIKSATGGIQISLFGPIECKTGPWHPAIITARDDDTVGELISGSTGNPTGVYAMYPLALRYTGSTYDIHDLRIRHATYGIPLFASSKATIRHVQIRDVSRGVAWQNNVLVDSKNFLFYNIENAYWGAGTPYTNRAEHGTFHRIKNFVNTTNYSACLTNSLLISVTNNLIYVGAGVVESLSDVGVFQTVGAGAHYLADGSPYRDVGIAGISGDLLSALAKRTTFPPGILTNFVAEDLILGTGVALDTNAPDYGYHYDPIDVIASSVTVSNATVLITNGITVGIEFAGTNFGIRLNNAGKVISEGFPDRMNRFVRLHSVQDLAATASSNAPMFAEAAGLAILPEARFRFTDFPLLSSSHTWNGSAFAGNLNSLALHDCTLRGGVLYLTPAVASVAVTLTNTLLSRVIFAINPSASVSFDAWNNLFRYGSFSIDNSVGASIWRLFDNLFDQTLLSQSPSCSLTHNYNGYVTNAGRLTPAALNDKILTNVPTYLAGPLGEFYYPVTDGMLSTLINAGSRIGGSAGLYHYTTTTNQVKETDSVVDIGFHYVATGPSVSVADSDLDGLPDYFEDKNGNGTLESSETDAMDSDTDYDGRTDWLEYLDQTNPLDSGSVVSSLLASWSFFDYNFIGDQGQVPIVNTNAICDASTTNPAVHICTNVPARLTYAEVQANLTPNINLRNGTVSFLFKPGWTSVSLGGTGPGQMGRLLEVGQESTNAMYGHWALCVSPGGSNLVFCTQGNGFSITNASASIAWESNRWYLVVLTYSPSNSAIFVDGQQLASGTGVTEYPGKTVRQSDGFSVGSDKTGTVQAQGIYDQLQTFNSSVNSCSPQGFCSVWPPQAQTTECLTPRSCYVSQSGVTLGGAIYQCPRLFAALLYPSPEAPTVGEVVPFTLGVGTQPGAMMTTMEFRDFSGRYSWVNYISPFAFATPTVTWEAAGVFPEGERLIGAANTSSGSILASTRFRVHFRAQASTTCGSPVQAMEERTVWYNTLPPIGLQNWNFDHHKISDGGVGPFSEEGVASVPGFSGNGVSIDNNNSSAIQLLYGGGASSVIPTIPTVKHNLGTIRFWFKPNWSSTSIQSGQGPGTSARLVGLRTHFDAQENMWPEGWSIRVNSSGTAIELHDSGGTGVSYSFGPISWTAGHWHQIVVTYGAGVNSTVYADGVQLGQAQGGLPYWGAAPAAMAIGTDANGLSQARGAFDEVQTFNYQLSATKISEDYQALVSVDSDGDGVTDLLEGPKGTSPFDPDTDSDGVFDDSDAFPLDPSRSEPVPATNPNDTTPPTIELLEPSNAVPQ